MKYNKEGLLKESPTSFMGYILPHKLDLFTLATINISCPAFTKPIVYVTSIYWLQMHEMLNYCSIHYTLTTKIKI